MTPGGSDPTLQLQIIINGIEDVKNQLGDIQKKGEEAAAKVDDAFQKSSQSLMQLSEKAGRFGSIWTQNVTMPIIALGTAAVAMSMDVLKGEESVGKLTEAWKDLKSDVATAIVPTINALITDTLIPLVNTLGDLTEAWGKQSDAAKNAELMILGMVAIVGPVTTAAANIGKAIGLLKLGFIALKTEAWAAWAAVAGPVAIVAGVAAGAYYVGTEIAEAIGLDEGTNRYRSPAHTDYGDLSMYDRSPYWDVRAQEERERDAIWAMMQEKANRKPLNIGGGGGGGGATTASRTPANFYSYPDWGMKFPFAGMVSDPWAYRAWDGATLPNYMTGYEGHGGGWKESQYESIYGPWRGGPKPGPDQKAMERFLRNQAEAKGGGGAWYDALMSNDFLMNAGMTLGGMAIGGASGRDMVGAALPLIGSAFGPVGAAVGGLLGMLVGKKKDRGDTPQNPVHVKVINPGDLATALSNAVKSLVAQLGAGGMNDLVKQVRMQGQLKGYS